MIRFPFWFLLAVGLIAGPITPAAAQEAPLPNTTPAVRGVWLTNVASDALYSRENIQEAVGLCSELGFNSIFVVTWNDTYTTYPSALLESITGQGIHPDFAGRDPLRELIDAAHAKDIKVFAWFEFGFAATMNDTAGGVILQKNPHWASRDQEGRITEKNGFQWMNPFHPEVQDFIKELVLEVVRNYDIDGIQGDDRLPALPSNGGYDDLQ
ncbi:MAG: family 10 glycosylhydrolase [Phaeodactylibacter sp.]|nr:family 10 glycosylhydrolase [Phaeodactylibacter sp.]